MKTPTSRCTLRLTLALVVGSSLCRLAWAGLQIPYTPDASTLHLWHLDDPDGLTATDAVATSSIVLTNLGMPNPGIGPYTNVNLGSPSFLGQGTCLVASNKQHLLYGGSFPDVSQFCNPVSGAFTFEAIVRFDTDPTATIDAEIVSGDNGLGIGNRGWQWRIFNGVMEWDLLAGSTDNDYKSNLPKIGANAAIAGAWYHVAVTYTGDAPTNSDPANVMTFYWTLLDANRIAADPLGQFTTTRPLSGAPQGTATPSLGVAGSARNTTSNPGNNEGLIGAIDEVRISNVALSSNQMAFAVGGTINPPSITRQPPSTTLVGYGRPLTVPCLASGSLPLSYTWLLNGSPVPGQTQTTLYIPSPTFADAGGYQLVVSNDYGSQTSQVAQVVVGAAPNGLFHTGLDTNGVVSAGDIPDPHWTLYRSADPAYLGPNTLIFGYAYPIQFADPNGNFSPTNGISMWMGAGGNQGGVTFNSPAGQYLYRSRFLIDSADPATVTMGGNLWVNGSISDILVNGKSSGISLAPGGTLYTIPFAITNGFVAGWNTLDFVENLTGAGISGLRVEISGAGLALPPGMPTLIQQPADQTVRDGSVSITPSEAVFEVAALGRPPLSYQWWADGAVLPGATDRVLAFTSPTAGAQGQSFSVVVSNDSGSITSRVARLTLVGTNQPPVPAGFSAVAFQNQPTTFYLSDMVQKSVDPDHDPITFLYADSSSTNGFPLGLFNVVQNGATLVYTPPTNYVGADQFSYTIMDPTDFAVGLVNLLALLAPTNQIVAVGGTAHFDTGLSTMPAGYSLEWQHNGTNIDNATGAYLTVANAQIADAGGYTVLVTDPLGQVWSSPIAGLTVGTLGNGTGLTGDYYGYANGTTNFTGMPTLTEVDATVDFDWGTAAPDPSLPVDYFQVRWHGQVQPLYSDVYTFSTTSDDGSRLWVDGQGLVDRWVNGAATIASGTIALTANQKYDLVMEYYENTSAASAQLSWSSLHQFPQVVPMTQLYPSVGPVRPLLGVSLSGTNLMLNWAGTFTLQSAPSVTGPWSTVAVSTVGPFRVPTSAAAQQYYRLVTLISP